MSLTKKLAAEFLGTFWLVLGGCGSAVLAAHFGGDGNPLGIGFLGVALAFGLTVLTGAYAFGHISGGHFNPAVSVGLWAGGRFSAKELLPYVVAQVAGGIAAGFILITCIRLGLWRLGRGLRRRGRILWVRFWQRLWRRRGDLLLNCVWERRFLHRLFQWLWHRNA